MEPKLNIPLHLLLALVFFDGVSGISNTEYTDLFMCAILFCETAFLSALHVKPTVLIQVASTFSSDCHHTVPHLMLPEFEDKVK